MIILANGGTLSEHELCILYIHLKTSKGLGGREDGPDCFSPASRNVTKLFQRFSLELLTAR